MVPYRSIIPANIVPFIQQLDLSSKFQSHEGASGDLARIAHGLGIALPDRLHYRTWRVETAPHSGWEGGRCDVLTCRSGPQSSAAGYRRLI